MSIYRQKQKTPERSNSYFPPFNLPPLYHFKRHTGNLCVHDPGEEKMLQNIKCDNFGQVHAFDVLWQTVDPKDGQRPAANGSRQQNHRGAKTVRLTVVAGREREWNQQQAWHLQHRLLMASFGALRWFFDYKTGINQRALHSRIS